MSNKAYVIEADCGDLLALAITEAQAREVAELRPELPVMTTAEVERVGVVMCVLGGRVERVRRP